MIGLPVVAGFVAGLLGASLALVGGRRAAQSPPRALIRENHRGKEVGAVLGIPLVSAGTLGPLLLMFTDSERRAGFAGAALLLLLLLGGAGLWDDLRGDEKQRGFRGHLRAAKGMRLTGGLVKLLLGGTAGLLVSALLIDGALGIVLSGAIIALSANLINLFDRAPGRAGKVALLLLLPLLFVSPIEWRVSAAALIGASIALLPLDLKERGMLGDAGANPLGAMAGLGLALSLPNTGRLVAATLLLAVNVASERWSFSAAIRDVPVLARLDGLGREKKSP